MGNVGGERERKREDGDGGREGLGEMFQESASLSCKTVQREHPRWKEQDKEKLKGTKTLETTHETWKQGLGSSSWQPREGQKGHQIEMQLDM